MTIPNRLVLALSLFLVTGCGAGSSAPFATSRSASGSGSGGSGSGSFPYNWAMTSSTSYTLSSASTVDFDGGVCELKADQMDLDDTSLGFGSATLTGTTWDSSLSSVRLSTSSATNNSEIDSSWVPASANLVGLWHLDGTVGSIANGGTLSDSSGNGYDVTVSGAGASYASGKMNQGVSFTGQTAYISNVSSGPDPCTAVTVAFWMKASAADFSAWATFMDRTGWATTNPGYAIQEPGSGNSLFLKVDTAGGENNIYWNSNDNFFDAHWHFVAFTLSGGTASLYKDGFLDTTGSYSSGNFCNSAQNFILNDGAAGEMDELAVWSTALTASQMAEIYARQSAQYAGTVQSRVIDGQSASVTWQDLAFTSALPYGKELPDSGSSESSAYSSESAGLMSNIAGLWHLDEASGTSGSASVLDHSGNSQDGTPTSVTFGEPSILGTSAGFNGTSSEISVPYSTSLNPSAFTISAWMNPQYLTGSAMSIVESRSGTSNGFALTASSSALAFDVSGTSVTDSGTFNGDGWVHVVGTYNGSTATLYVNGVSVGSASAALTANSTGALTIGGGLAGYFTGHLDEIALWSRALSSSEVVELYRRGANRVKFQVRSCPDSTCSTNPTWLGPDGTDQTYFSELNNNSSQAAGGDLTSGDSVSTSGADLTFSNFGSLSVGTNEFVQYRAILESDDSSSNCSYGGSSSWCSPEIQKIGVGPQHYDSSSPAVTTNTGVSFSTLTSFAETLGSTGCSSGVTYELSLDKTSWYYYNGSSWSAANGTAAEASSASVINSNIANFASQVGTGTLYVKAFLSSSGTSACALENVQVGGS